MSEQTAGLTAAVKFAVAMRDDAFPRGDLEAYQAWEHVVRFLGLAEKEHAVAVAALERIANHNGVEFDECNEAKSGSPHWPQPCLQRIRQIAREALKPRATDGGGE